jgi:hypothetical protein
VAIGELLGAVDADLMGEVALVADEQYQQAAAVDPAQRFESVLDIVEPIDRSEIKDNEGATRPPVVELRERSWTPGRALNCDRLSFEIDTNCRHGFRGKDTVGEADQQLRFADLGVTHEDGFHLVSQRLNCIGKSQNKVFKIALTICGGGTRAVF